MRVDYQALEFHEERLLHTNHEIIEIPQYHLMYETHHILLMRF